MTANAESNRLNRVISSEFTWNSYIQNGPTSRALRRQLRRRKSQSFVIEVRPSHTVIEQVAPGKQNKRKKPSLMFCEHFLFHCSLLILILLRKSLPLFHFFHSFNFHYSSLRTRRQKSNVHFFCSLVLYCLFNFFSCVPWCLYLAGLFAPDGCSLNAQRSKITTKKRADAGDVLALLLLLNCLTT